MIRSIHTRGFAPRAIAAAALALLAACGGGDGGTPVTPPAPTVASVTVSPDGSSLMVGEQRQLSVAAFDASGTPVTITGVAWTSSDSSKVRVSSTGVATGVALGSAYAVAIVGGRSGQATVKVEVGAPSSLVKVTADGAAPIAGTRVLQAKVTDAGGSPVAGQTVAWAVTQGNGTLSAPTSVSDASGVAEVTWTIGTRSGTQTVSATAPFTSRPAVYSATVSPGAADLTKSLVTTNLEWLTANGADSVTVTVQLRDAYGNPVPTSGGTVALTATAGTVGAVSDHGDGNYTAKYTAPTRTGEAVVSATLNGAALLNGAVVRMKAGPVAAYEVHAGFSSPMPAGVSPVSAYAIDAFGNHTLADGRTVSWTTTGGTLMAQSSAVQNGFVTTALTVGTVAGTQYRVTARDGEGNTGTSNVITVVPGNTSLTGTTLTATPRSIPADGHSTLTLTVQLKDDWGNDVPYTLAAVSIQASLGTVGPVSSVGGGAYQAKLTSGTLMANSVQVTAKLGGSLFSDVETVAFTAGAPAQCWIGVSTFTPAAGTAQAVYMRVLDAGGNTVPVGGRSVSWTSTNGGSFSPAAGTTTSAGEATTQFTASATPGVQHVLTAHDDAGGFSCSSSKVTAQ